MLYKIILFAILICLVYILFFGKKRKSRNESTTEDELMVECATCKMFIGVSEAVKKRGQYFCSQKCAKAK
ncbi:MAG: Prokaryotic metallothionein [Campylobacteraceae bacterium]|nr:Prokaryotic metallothionein [Campylobacteraceae bacterium]